VTTPTRTFSRTREGMTLIEVLVVVALFAVLMGAVTMSLGALTRTQLRSACMRIVAAASFSYNRAVADGKTLRISIDMDRGTLSIQEARSAVTIVSADDPGRGRDEEDGGEAVDPWAAAKARLEEPLKPSFGRSPFGPVTGRDGQALSRHQNQPLGDSVRVAAMYLPHERSVRLAGTGAIYFFPSGLTEHAVVHLTDGGDDRIYAVEIHPLTGRGKVHNFAFIPDQKTLEEGFDEVKDRR
jgi:general secretion pathway protein H